jgi:hypothetical protein
MVTKRHLMGVLERCESAIERLPRAASVAEVKDIVSTDLQPAKADLEYAIEIAAS